MTTLTLTGTTDLVNDGLVEDPLGTFSFPAVSLSQIDFIAAPGSVTPWTVAVSVGADGDACRVDVQP